AYASRASAFHVEKPHDPLLSDRQTGQSQEAPLQGEASVHSRVVLGVEGAPIQHQAKLRRHLGIDTAHELIKADLHATFHVFTEVQRQVSHDNLPHPAKQGEAALPRPWYDCACRSRSFRTHDLSVVGVLGRDVLRDVGARCLLPNEQAATAVVADNGLVLVIQDRLEVEQGELLVAEHLKMEN
ncbi:hypothetical protein JG687_00015324, partial [Phytophthora cactorum]